MTTSAPVLLELFARQQYSKTTGLCGSYVQLCVIQIHKPQHSSGPAELLYVGNKQTNTTAGQSFRCKMGITSWRQNHSCILAKRMEQKKI